MNVRRPTLALQRLVRIALALCAIVLGTAQVSLACHMALVAHRNCAEHGAVEHGREHATSSHAQRAHEDAVTTAASEHQDDHDACSQVGLDQALPEIAAALDSGAVTLTTAPDTLDRGRAIDDHQRYRLAPKSSPPV